jgi:dUTP pyrophosphatase
MDKEQIRDFGLYHPATQKLPCKKCSAVGYIQEGSYRDHCWECNGKGWVVPEETSFKSLKLIVRNHGQGLPLPSYATLGSSGIDLYAAVKEDLILQPMERKLIPTGVAVAIPVGFEGQIRPRSGLAYKYGIGMPNSIGTIDSDYRGELKVLLINLGQDPFVISRGDRIAQLVIAPVERVSLSVVEHLGSTHRGSGGFGSTGR